MPRKGPLSPHTAAQTHAPVSAAMQGGCTGAESLSARLPVHGCVDCAALPPAERPARPRPAPHGGPRSRRCATHQRALRQAQKTRAAAARSLRVYGLTPQLRAALWAVQGGACPCGRQPTREPDHDHDHELARGHDHPVTEACPDCMRGLCCRACNTYVLGRYSLEQLRALVAYLEDPPMRRLQRAHATEV